MRQFFISHKWLFISTLAILLAIGIILAVLTPRIFFDTHQGTQITCNSTGVTKNSNGTVSFARLAVNTNGDIVTRDNPSCPVHLLGTNSWWLDSDATAGPSAQELLAQQQALHTNIARIAINAYWWQSNVMVPKFTMPFRQLLQEVVHWEEQAGNYVELDIDAEFTEPPCRQDGLASCPSQDQGRKDFASNPACKITPNDATACPQAEELEEYQPTALSALTDLAQLYGNDPGVLFDVWNEPASYIFVIPGTINERQAWMDTKINTVR